MSLTTLTLEDLYSEVADLARDQGVSSKEQWDELVEDVVEDHLDLGELDLEEDSEGIKDDLKAKWGTFKKENTDEDEEEVLEEEEEGKKIEEDDDLFDLDEEID
jgi:hypothetical protein